MIKNPKQASLTKEKLKDLMEALTELEKNKGKYNDIEFQLTKDSLSVLISELQDLLKQYHDLKDGHFDFILRSLMDLPKLLISARIALGWSQKEFADKVQLKEQQIQRYEATDYETAAWPRVVEFAFVLGINFCPTKVSLHVPTAKKFEFSLPKSVSGVSLDNARVRLSKSILNPIES